MRKLVMIVTALGLIAGTAVNSSLARPDEDTIKKAMKTAMAGNGLLKKVSGGQASDDQKQELLRQFQSLAGATPPHGDAASWKAKTAELVRAAEAAVKGHSDAATQLKKAADCKACHSAHRG